MAIAVGVTLLVQNWNLRADVTAERLNSVAPETRKLIAGLDPKHPVVIEAYISPNVPEEFVRTKTDLLNLLREFEKIFPGKVKVKLFTNVEPLTDEAQRAEQQFGITPQEVFTQTRGAGETRKFFWARPSPAASKRWSFRFSSAAFRLNTNWSARWPRSRPKRKSESALCRPMRSYSAASISAAVCRVSDPKERLIEELEKQYEVVRVDPNQPITERYDVLLAIQPSSLPQAAMTNFIDAVKSGQPTAIFEDPLPFYVAGLQGQGTGMPRRPRQNPMMMLQQPPAEPKGDIKQLWDLLGVELVEKSRRGFIGELDKDYSVVWQKFKPTKFGGIDQLTPEYVFIERDAPHASEPFEPFNEKEPATEQLQTLIMPLPGGLTKLNAASTNFTPLIKTGTASGEIMVKDMMSARTSEMINAAEGKETKQEYVLAAHITGRPRSPDDEDKPDAKSEKTGRQENGRQKGR